MGGNANMGGGGNIANAFMANKATQPTVQMPLIKSPQPYKLPAVARLPQPQARAQVQAPQEAAWSRVKNNWASGDYSMTDALRDRGLTRENGYEFMADPRTGASLYRKVPTQPAQQPAVQQVYQPSYASRLAQAINAQAQKGR